MTTTKKKLDYMESWNEFLKENPDFSTANPDDVILPYTDAKNDNQKNTNAHHMLKAIIKKEVDDWNKKNKGENFPDYKNRDQYKYEPIASMDSSSGFGLSHFAYDRWIASSACGSRLCTPSSEICKRLFLKYISIYEVWFCK